MFTPKQLVKALGIIVGVILIFALTGCSTTAQAVPKSTFNWNPKTGEIAISSPKDAVLKNVVIVRGETNGMKFAQIQIGEYHASTNPEVVKESAAGTSQMILASGQVGAQMFAAGLAAAAQSMGVPKLPSPVPVGQPVIRSENVPAVIPKQEK